MIAKTFTNTEGLQEFLNSLGPNLAFDTETSDLNYTKLKIHGISLCDGKSACYIDLALMDNPSEAIALLRPMFASKRTLIAHNILFDMKVLHKYGIDITKARIYDTMVADHLINENRSHALKHLSSVLLQKETVQYEEAEKAGIHSDMFYEYAINDAVWTFELMQYQQDILKANPKVAKLFREVEMPFQLVLFEMETIGIEVDTDRIEELYTQCSEERTRVLQEMCNILGVEYMLQTKLGSGELDFVCSVNFNSANQLRKILFERYGLEIVEETPSGAPSVGKSTLNRYKDHEFVSLLYKYKLIEKALSSYLGSDAQIMKNLDSDGRVRTNFRDTGTATGRLSSSNPNIQQLSNKNKVYEIPIRQAFVATPGYTMMTADYSGQEVCVMAEISQDPTLVTSLRKGYDMHLAVANKFYNLGIPEEALSKEHKDYEKYLKEHKDVRRKAKTITFGLAYGKGAFGFSKDFGITEDEAQKLVDDYFSGMPQLKEAIDAAHREVWDKGYVEYLSGRCRHFNKTKRDDWEGYTKRDLRQAFNAKIQGYSADMIRIACNHIYKQREQFPQWDLRMLATVHDEIVMEVRSDYAEEAAEYIKKWMSEPFDWMSVPMTSDVSLGANYDEAK